MTGMKSYDRADPTETPQKMEGQALPADEPQRQDYG